MQKSDLSTLKSRVHAVLRRARGPRHAHDGTDVSEIGRLGAVDARTPDPGTSAPDTLALDALPPGSAARVSKVGGAHAGDLAQHGLVAGAAVRVESRAPLSGPLVVTIGRARLAIGAAVARSVFVEPDGAGAAMPPRADGDHLTEGARVTDDAAMPPRADGDHLTEGARVTDDAALADGAREWA
ncbi:MAG: FeoA family protein [Chloroflexi bacterium]|nr:FeoA family protein [Chloroflexota bacterium]